jgi:hypothetical protein
LARVETKLEKERVEHIQLMDDRAELTNAHAAQKRALEEQRRSGKPPQFETQLATEIKTQAAEFGFSRPNAEGDRAT